MERLLKIDFIRFCIVGASGFAINFVLLTLLYKKIGLHILISQLIAGEIALFSNFMLHHHWTYKRNKVSKSIKNLLWQFHATTWVAIVGSALLVSFGVHILNLNYVIALMISSAIALLWNFGWSKFVIWRHEAEVHVKEGAK